MKKRFGLLGEKLSHSYSPLIHGYLGEYEYPLYEVSPGGLDGFLRERSFDGINVTVPYKQAVAPYCASLALEARLSGSVNTLIKDAQGELHGYNTDYHGFVSMLEAGGISAAGKKALILGDGGSAGTVRAALAATGAREIVTVSRRAVTPGWAGYGQGIPGQARDDESVIYHEDNYGNTARHFDAQIIINATPVGMYPDTEASPLPLTGFGQLGAVADLIYNPARTRLLLEAERLGIPCINGLIMLAAQAELASRLFTNGPARPHLVEEIAAALRKKMLNIALIGMPGCGKSAAGRALAQDLGRPLADTDELIEAAAGKSITQIFAEDGEAAFRELETRMLAQEAKKSGLVIAAGGGVVTRPSNLDLLRQNSVIIYLRRALGELAIEGRPLSQDMGIAALAQQRLPLYEAWSDHVVTVEADVRRTVEKIQEAVQ